MARNVRTRRGAATRPVTGASASPVDGSAGACGPDRCRFAGRFAGGGPTCIRCHWWQCGRVDGVPNRLRHAMSPYLQQHADNPVDWWPWGEEAFDEARRRDVPVMLTRRVRRVPLVPRHGPRVVQGPGRRRADERGFRQREGRPRGAPRRRRRLHGGHAGVDRSGRLAHDGVPDPRRPSVLRRHLLPAGAPARPAVVRAAAGSGRKRVAGPARRRARGGAGDQRAARRGPAPGRPTPREEERPYRRTRRSTVRPRACPASSTPSTGASGVPRSSRRRWSSSSCCVTTRAPARRSRGRPSH